MAKGTRSSLFTLVFALLCPTICSAVPIVGDTAFGTDAVVGWRNELGIFATYCCDGGSFLHGASDAGTASYSTSSSLFSWSATDFSYSNEAGEHIQGAAEVRIDALVQGNGTDSGNLLAGILTLRAGADGFGFEREGIVPGQLLLAGRAIEAAATATSFTPSFLFELTYADPFFSGLGDFVTFWGTHGRVWVDYQGDDPNSHIPWGVDWGPSSGAIEYTMVRTFRVPEPPTLVLAAFGFVAIAFARRRRR